MRILISIIIWIGEIVGAGAALFLLYWGPLYFGFYILAEKPDGWISVLVWIMGLLSLALLGLIFFLVLGGILILIDHIKPLHQLLRLAKCNLTLSDKIWSKAKPTWDEVKEGEP